MAAIVVEGASKHWTTAEGQVRAVDRISFSLDEGTLNVLLGPSGCGKSTTLRLIAGLEIADGGTILIAGRDVTRLPPSQRNISMVFQSYALFPHLTVAENILFGLRVRKVAPGECDRRLAETASLLGLSSLLARKPGQLDPVDDAMGWTLDAGTRADIERIVEEEVTDPVGPEFMAPPDRERRAA